MKYACWEAVGTNSKQNEASLPPLTTITSLVELMFWEGGKRNLKDEKEPARRKSRGRAFWAEGQACAKILRQDPAWHVKKFSKEAHVAGAA